MASTLSASRAALRAAIYTNELDVARGLLAQTRALPAESAHAAMLAEQILQRARQRRADRGPLETFLQEFGLSTDEGIALLCLAEALLRVPDSDTADNLIA